MPGRSWPRAGGRPAATVAGTVGGRPRGRRRAATGGPPPDGPGARSRGRERRRRSDHAGRVAARGVTPSGGSWAGSGSRGGAGARAAAATPAAQGERPHRGGGRRAVAPTRGTGGVYPTPPAEATPAAHRGRRRPARPCPAAGEWRAGWRRSPRGTRGTTRAAHTAGRASVRPAATTDDQPPVVPSPPAAVDDRGRALHVPCARGEGAEGRRPARRGRGRQHTGRGRAGWRAGGPPVLPRPTGWAGGGTSSAGT